VNTDARTSRCGPAARRVPARTAPVLVAAVLAVLLLGGCAASKSLVPAGSVTPGPLESNGPISWTEAASRVGEVLAVQGPVTSTGSDGAGGIVLNVGAPASDPSRLVVIIPEAALGKFPADPASYYGGQLLTAIGRIEDRGGTPTVVVASRRDLRTGL
jgi:hypothetical protein